jgi:MFS family permease
MAVRTNRTVFLAIGWLAMVAYFAQRWVYGPLIPSLMKEFGADKTALGVVGAASLWGYMLTPIISGLLSDRFGRKWVLLFGIFGFSIFTIVCGFATSTSQLFAGRFLTGTMEAFFATTILAFTLELFPERPGFFLTLISSGSSLGWFVGPALAGRLLDLTGSWRAPFFVTGLGSLGIAFLLLLFWPGERTSVRAGVLFDRVILKKGNLLMLLILSLATAFQVATEFGFTMWYPVFLRAEAHTTATMAGFLAGIFGIGQFLGRPILGHTSDKIGYRPTGVAGGILMGLALAMVLHARTPVAQGVFTFLAGFCGASVMGSLWTFTGLVFPTFKGLSIGVINTVAYVTASLAPITIGYMGDHYSVAAGMWAVCVPAAFLASILFLFTYLLKPPLKASRSR